MLRRNLDASCRLLSCCCLSLSVTLAPALSNQKRKEENKMVNFSDLELASVRNVNDAKKQAKIAAKIADEKMDEYMKTAPEYVKKITDYGIPKEAIFGVGGTTLTVVFLYVLIAYGASILAAFITTLQPLWFTYRALETETKDDDTILLTYWMVYGVLYMLEATILFPIVELLSGPYFLAKMGVLFWMLNFEGSTVVYEKLLAPYFRKNEGQFKEVVTTAGGAALQLVGVKVPSSAAEKDI